LFSYLLLMEISYQLCPLCDLTNRSVIQDEPIVRFTKLETNRLYGLILWDLDKKSLHWWISNIRKEGGGTEMIPYLAPIEENRYVFYLVEQQKRVMIREVKEEERYVFPIAEHIQTIIERQEF